MIKRGTVEVVLHEKMGKEYVHSRLQAGGFFGEIELLRDGKSIANIRAGNTPVVVLAIPRADFLRVMEESPITAEAIDRIVQKRLEEQQVADRYAGRP
jgi:CRP-like cAMP-binding protein